MIGTVSSMEELDELYKEVILDHYQQPRNRALLENADVSEKGFNPLCGDQVQLQLKWKDGTLQEIGLQGHGCAISVASGSMMTEAVKGKTREEAQALASRVRRMFKEQGPSGLSDLGDIEVLEGVKKFPVRIKCALLPWTTLEQGLSR